MADDIAVVALIGQHGAGIAVALLHQALIRGHIMGLALAEYDPNGETCGIAPQMDFGAEATARTAECLLLLLTPLARSATMRSDDGAIDHLQHVSAQPLSASA